MNLVSGEWIELQANESNGEYLVKSPADLAIELARVRFSYGLIDRALLAARTSLASWRKTHFQYRKKFVEEFLSKLVDRQSAIIDFVALETGKPKSDLEKEFSLAVLQAKNQIQLFADHFKVQDEPRPRSKRLLLSKGIVVAIQPFCQPILHTIEALVVNVLAGNCVVIKPSEKTPLSTKAIVEVMVNSQLPSAIVQLIQGDKEVGRRLAIHEYVDLVLFTGSTEVGTRIKQDTLTQTSKELILRMGAKNSALVWSDADVGASVSALLDMAFKESGQNCRSVSRVVVHDKIFDEFVQKLHQGAKNLSIGHPQQNAFMGPLIDPGAVDRYLKFLGIAAREGGETIMRGKSLELSTRGHYVTPSLCVMDDNSVSAAKKSVIQQTEFLAPNLVILKTDDLDHALSLTSASSYGLLAHVFCKDIEMINRANEDLEVGTVFFNAKKWEELLALNLKGFKKSANVYYSGDQFGLNFVRERNCVGVE